MGAVDGLQRGSLDLMLTGRGSGGTEYVFDGKTKIVNAAYSIPYCRIEGLNATTGLHITPDEIALPDVVGRPRQGGIVNAMVRLLHWQSPDKPAPGAGPPPAKTIRARVHGVLASTVLQAVADPGYRDYGFDTAGEGSVNIDWTGAADDLTVAAVLTMSPPRSGARGRGAAHRFG